MPIPKTLIVCKSIHHQNTALIAKSLSNVLIADFCEPEEISADLIPNYDLVGFGSGIYFGRFHPALRTLIDGLPDASQMRTKAFVFSTSGLPALWRLWHWPLTSKLRRKGFEIAAEFHCGGFDTVGPLRLFGGLNRRHPDSNDLENAAAFARRLLTQFSEIELNHSFCPSP